MTATIHHDDITYLAHVRADRMFVAIVETGDAELIVRAAKAMASRAAAAEAGRIASKLIGSRPLTPSEAAGRVTGFFEEDDNRPVEDIDPRWVAQTDAIKADAGEIAKSAAADLRAVAEAFYVAHRDAADRLVPATY